MCPRKVVDTPPTRFREYLRDWYRSWKEKEECRNRDKSHRRPVFSPVLFGPLLVEWQVDEVPIRETGTSPESYELLPLRSRSPKVSRPRSFHFRTRDTPLQRNQGPFYRSHPKRCQYGSRPCGAVQTVTSGSRNTEYLPNESSPTYTSYLDS